jgi:hypothetical protein
MGQGADDALDRVQRESDHYEKFKDSDFATQYKEGLIDETGATIGDPTSFPGLNISHLLRSL